MALRATSFEAEGYRSLRRISYPLSDLDVFVGANGAGKTNLYRALELLRAAAANTLAQELTVEGGLASTRWAGHRAKSAEIRLAVGLTDPDARQGATFRYEVALGQAPPVAAAFENEPQVRRETLSLVTRQRTVRLLDRKGASVMARDGDGRPVEIDLDLMSSETVLGRLEDPSRYPEIDAVGRTLLQWRFYHGLRTDAGSPLRRPCPAAATATLASDGSDLAAVLATLAQIRQDTAELDAAVAQAFPGARLLIPKAEREARFVMTFAEFPGRHFEAHELSDGTLRFLALAGALLAYRLPAFLALNEPEASLHPDLMEPLAGLIAAAARRTQVWLVTHSTQLAEAVAAQGGGAIRTVVKRGGATEVEGLKLWGEFAEDVDD